MSPIWESDKRINVVNSKVVMQRIQLMADIEIILVETNRHEDVKSVTVSVSS